MAPQWLTKVKEFVAGKRDPDPAEPPDGAPGKTGAVAKTGAVTGAKSPATSAKIDRPLWRHLLPMWMLIVGLLFTLCSELLKLWAILGYLLVVAAPIVYWLERIEFVLQQLVANQRRDDER